MSKRLLALCGFLLFIAWLEIRRAHPIEERYRQQLAASSARWADTERDINQMSPEEYANYALYLAENYEEGELNS